MNRSEISSYSETKSGKLWRYGFEAWCNLEGQYLHIVADLRELKGRAYEMSICSLGIMGMDYGRDNKLQEIVDVLPGNEISFEVEKIRALFPIGNHLNIF